MILCEEAPPRIINSPRTRYGRQTVWTYSLLPVDMAMSRKKAGRKAVHMKHSGGLYIFPENNRFFQWTGPDDGIKGGAIDFVMREENLSFPEAVGKLIGKEYAAEARQVTPYEKKERGPLVLPEKGGQYEAGLLVSGVHPRDQSTNRQPFYESEDDLSGEKSTATACLWVMTPRNAPVLLHAGGQRKQLI